MNRISLVSALTLGAALLVGCSSAEKKKETNEIAGLEDESHETMFISHENVSKLIEDWPDTSKAAANSMVSKYGLPQEASQNLLVWNDTAPFKRTKVYKEEVTHNFPFPHYDVLAQVIEYRVPEEKVDELVKFNGSLLYDRTKGELTARGDKEEINTLALNLADEIIKGKKTVEEARLEFARSASAFSMGNTNQYTSALMFTPASETADADYAIDLKTGNVLRGGMEAQESREAQEAQKALEESSDLMEEE